MVLQGNIMQTVLITGGTGFIGKNLLPLLQKNNYNIIILTRNPEKYTDDFFFKHVEFISDLNALSSADIVINLAGENLSNKRWSQSFKQKIFESRVASTIKLIDWITACEKKPHTFISGSAIGYYGSRADEVLTEQSAAGDNDEFQVALCQNWELSAIRAEQSGVRTCLIRTGVVLGNEGALQQILPPFKFGLGGKLGSGKQYFSWIHIHDQVNAIMHLINNPKLEGVFNLTSPNPVTNMQLTKTIGSVLKRPTFASMPGFALKLIMGEMANILLTGQQVIPQKLVESGFEFRYPDLQSALEDLVI